MKILITGIAGCGKSTIISELKERGHQAIDLDTCNVCAWINKKTGATTDYKEGSGQQWIDAHRWQVITPKLLNLISSLDLNKDIYIGGKVAKIQVNEMASIFDRIYLLQPNDAIIDDRLKHRTSNIKNFAKTKEERMTIIRNRHEFEEACLKAKAIVLDNHGSVEEIISKLVNK